MRGPIQKAAALASLVCALAGAGCGAGTGDASNGTAGGGDAEKIARTSQAIQGGSDDTTHGYALGFCGGSPNNCTTYCSATLIAPNLLLTARHCVAPTPPGSIDCSRDSFGATNAAAGFYATTDSDMFSATHWFHADQIITPSDASVCGSDLALVILKEPVPASLATPVTPNVMYGMTESAHAFASETAIGYGVDAPSDRTSYGHRRIRQAIGIDCVPNDADPKRDCYQGTGWSPVAIGPNEYAAFGGTCEGDSGSGAFEQSSFDGGKPLVIGTLSRGMVDGDTCSHAVYTRLDAWAALIIDTARSAATLGGYAAPDWTNATPPIEPDAGARGGSQAGANPSSSTVGALGAACSTDRDCADGQCAKLGEGPFVCTESCSTSASCPTGFTCRSSSCFAESASQPQSVTPGTSGGCSMASASGRDPSKPIPWIIGAIAAACAVARKRLRHSPAD